MQYGHFRADCLCTPQLNFRHDSDKPSIWTCKQVSLYLQEEEEHQEDANRSDGRFAYSRRVAQFGANGGFYYGRLVCRSENSWQHRETPAYDRKATVDGPFTASINSIHHLIINEALKSCGKCPYPATESF